MDERLIIAQPPFGAVGSVPVAVGVLWYHAAARRLLHPQCTLIVKAAFSFAPGPDGALSEHATLLDPPPPSVGDPSELPGATPEELAYPTDFLPEKGAVDVLVVGHAYAPHPSERIDASIVVGKMRRELTVLAGGPAARLPLSSAYLRAGDGKGAAEPAGPVLPQAFHRIHASVEASRYATAAPSQQVDAIAPGEPIELRGLSPRAPRRVVRVPDLAPAAVAVFREGHRAPIELTCDTLWIDTDRELLVMVWRGILPLAAPTVERAIERVDLWLESKSAPREEASLQRDLQRGSFAWAVEEAEAAEGIAPPPIPPEQLSALRYALWSESPAPALTLERYTWISAELLEKREDRADTLLRHRLDEDAWSLEERAWLDWMGAAALRGDALPAKQYGDLFLAAQAKLASPEEAAWTIDDYVPLKAAMDRGADPTRALAAFAMTLPAWMRLDRRFEAAAASDPALRDEIERRSRSATVDPRLLDDDVELDAAEEDDEDDA